MTNDERKAIVRRYYDETWSRGNLELIDELMADSYRNLDPATPGGGVIEGREGFKQLVAGFRTTFPDLRMTIEGQVAEGETVVSWWTATGTMSGPFIGMPATGKQGSVTGITITRFSGNRIVEDRANWDTLGLLVQCDLLPGGEPVAA